MYKRLMAAAAALLVLSACGGGGIDGTDEEALEESARAYTDAFLAGDGDKAMEFFSASCQETLPENLFKAASEDVSKMYDDKGIKTIEVEVDGDSGTASYTFADSELDQTDEPWVVEDGQWKLDDC